MAVPGLPLLSTKLNRPPVTGDRIDRPRLFAILNRGLAGSLTVVSAAAGFGKTTLVSSWIDSLAPPGREPLPIAWLSLDPADSELEVFLRYFVAAIRTLYPESCSGTLALLAAPVLASQAPLLISLTNEIEQLPGRIVLVLDDYHTIRGEAVHDFLSEVLRHWPQHLHLILISRNSPPLPMANLRAREQVAEIRTRDIRFTAEESAAFLNKALPAPLSEPAVALLDQRLEGWIAGLRLVTLSMFTGAVAGTDLVGLSGTHGEITEYLVDEVISHQTPAMLEFLLATSILDRFCAELCECLLGTAHNGVQYEARACIEWLDSHNLFVVPLDNDRKWYRYHHMFQELLQRRLLAEISQEQVAQLHRLAAAWLADQGSIEEAIQHALAAADLDLTAQVMVAGFCDALNREDRATLDRWLRLLPAEFIERRHSLLIIKAYALQYGWRLSAVWKVIVQLETLLDKGSEQPPCSSGWEFPSDNTAPPSSNPQDPETQRGLIALLRGQQAFTQGQAERAIAYCVEALALLPKGWRYARGGAAIYWGMSMRAVGRAAAAERALLEDYASLQDKTDAYALRLPFAVCNNALETGDLEQARRMAQVMLEQSMSGQLTILKGFAHYYLGAVHYHWNELDEAGEHFEWLVDKRYSVHAQAARNAILALARVHLARGDTVEASEMMELLSELDWERTGQEGDDASSLRAQIAYLREDTEAAFRWADAYPPAVPDRLLNWFQDPHLAKAALLVARGRPADLQAALAILDALQGIAERMFSTRVLIEVLALRALALEKQEKTAAALAALERAVELARFCRFIRVFVDLGPPMQTLLLRLVGRGFAAETVRRILAAFPEPSSKTGSAGESRARAANASLLEPLTARELGVLSLLRERLSNKEIAQMLGLSVMTVKRHTVNIYGKLGVDNRRDAVVEAESLNILPSR